MILKVYTGQKKDYKTTWFFFFNPMNLKIKRTKEKTDKI